MEPTHSSVNPVTIFDMACGMYLFIHTINDPVFRRSPREVNQDGLGYNNSADIATICSGEATVSVKQWWAAGRQNHNKAKESTSLQAIEPPESNTNKTLTLVIPTLPPDIPNPRILAADPVCPFSNIILCILISATLVHVNRVY